MGQFRARTEITLGPENYSPICQHGTNMNGRAEKTLRPINNYIWILYHFSSISYSLLRRDQLISVYKFSDYDLYFLIFSGFCLPHIMQSFQSCFMDCRDIKIKFSIGLFLGDYLFVVSKRGRCDVIVFTKSNQHRLCFKIRQAVDGDLIIISL